jgi:hypothetical protein
LLGGEALAVRPDRFRETRGFGRAVLALELGGDAAGVDLDGHRAVLASELDLAAEDHPEAPLLHGRAALLALGPPRRIHLGVRELLL